MLNYLFCIFVPCLEFVDEVVILEILENIFLKVSISKVTSKIEFYAPNKNMCN